MTVKNSIFQIKTDNSKNKLPSSAKNNVGRKAKAVEDKASKPITLKFTPAEFDAIVEKAGLTNKATFLKDFLMNKAGLLK